MKIRSAEFSRGIRGTDPVLLEPKLNVAFIGRSNVGKSSLMNCLLNRRDLVKSGKTPGKTLELNFFLVNGDSYFVDLPGYGYVKASGEAREQLAKMIQWYLFQIKIEKRMVVVVLDAFAGPSDMDLEMLRLLAEHDLPTIVVANKIDKLNQKERHAALKAIADESFGFEVIPCSAVTKEGKEVILGLIG